MLKVIFYTILLYSYSLLIIQFSQLVNKDKEKSYASLYKINQPNCVNKVYDKVLKGWIKNNEKY